MEDAEVRKHFSAEDIKRLLEPKNYTGSYGSDGGESFVGAEAEALIRGAESAKHCHSLRSAKRDLTTVSTGGECAGNRAF